MEAPLISARRALFHLVLGCVSVLSVPCVVAAQKPSPLIVISVDGMKPEYATQAKEHGLKLPELDSFLTHGTYAEGVIGVIPTVTYPSHTTLITGVNPAEHGIYDNTIFDPLREHPNTWYWYFSAIKSETLYQAADKAGLMTAAVGWPVTVGAPIDYNIAEYTESENAPKPTAAQFHPADILARIGYTPTKGSDPDDRATAESIAILRHYKPTLLLIHLTQLDHEEHGYGPFSPEADATIERIDGQVKQIEDAAMALDPKTRIVIVSDHGFMAVDHNMNLNVLLAQAGLIHLAAPAAGQKGPKVTSWEAEAWPAGGDTAVMLRDPHDTATLRKVQAVLDVAEANPDYKITQVLDHDALIKLGGFPEASFLVDFKDGMEAGNALSGAVVTPAPVKGMHGFLPTNPQMRSTFMAKGSGIAEGRDLHVIQMLQIAPTLAKMLDVTLPVAKAAPLPVKP
jgi:predicted AlkP superfamily pyrophosphatase or phosphodiesterase